MLTADPEPVSRGHRGHGRADWTDWITDCVTQVEVNELLGLLKRNVAVMDVPDPPFWWK